jgi:hypothetical protein
LHVFSVPEPEGYVAPVPKNLTYGFNSHTGTVSVSPPTNTAPHARGVGRNGDYIHPNGLRRLYSEDSLWQKK